MATEPARRFEPIAPLRDVGRSFEPASMTGHRFVPQGANEAAAPDRAPATPAEIEALRREAFDRGVAEGKSALPWQEAAALERTLAALDPYLMQIRMERRDRHA